MKKIDGVDRIMNSPFRESNIIICGKQESRITEDMCLQRQLTRRCVNTKCHYYLGYAALKNAEKEIREHERIDVEAL